MALSEHIDLRDVGDLKDGFGRDLPVNRSSFFSVLLRTLIQAAKSGCLYVPMFACVFALLVPVHTVLLEQTFGLRIAMATLIFLIGGLAGGAVAWIVAAVFARGRQWSARFCIAMIANAFLVPLATAFVFFLQYRDYYAHWHEPAFSNVWFWQMGFTGVTAIYLFIVSAVKYIFPLGFFVLVGASAIFARWSSRLA